MSKLTEAMTAVSKTILREKDFLTELDAKIGDSDHGINMAHGFHAVEDALASISDPTNPKLVLETVGETLLENVGGAAGDEKLTVASCEKLFGAAVEAIKKRGRAGKGDKTMLDVLIPIYECFTPEYADGLTLRECLTEANYAATDGVEYTKTIAARKGRASYLGERSIGYQDPGATSAMLMYRAVYQFLNPPLEGGRAA